MSQSRPNGTWLKQAVQPTLETLGPSPVPGQFAEATLDTIPSRRMRELVRKYGANFWDAGGGGIAPVLLGPVGTFKSYAAAVISRQVRDVARVRTGWCTVPIDLTKLERSRYTDATDRQIQEWKEVPLLVMDDFGMVRVASWQYDILVEIAMERFAAVRPTIWTGNVLVDKVSPDGLRQTMTDMLGAQLTRRILERSEGYRLYIGSTNRE